jgi:hypothetical protein
MHPPLRSRRYADPKASAKAERKFCKSPGSVITTRAGNNSVALGQTPNVNFVNHTGSVITTRRGNIRVALGQTMEDFFGMAKIKDGFRLEITGTLCSSMDSKL